MEERRHIIRSDEATKWGWLGPGLTVFVLIGLVGTAIATAYIIGKQQAAAKDRQAALLASRALAEKQGVRKQFDALRAERDTLRADVARLYAELEKLRRQQQPEPSAASRCINGQRLIKRGAEWSDSGPC
ncbi:hypothetical protein [Lysobacter firmicutimachus]|uniref:Uncharacterized protein n=1 Tax=Lysobacter firmicutimachus TaxID=1792846 RepID=A0ABU8D2U6_9GAMM